MKNRSFLGKDDVAVAYAISSTPRVDLDRTLSTQNKMMRLRAEGQAAPVRNAASGSDDRPHLQGL